MAKSKKSYRQDIEKASTLIAEETAKIIYSASQDLEKLYTRDCKEISRKIQSKVRRKIKKCVEKQVK